MKVDRAGPATADGALGREPKGANRALTPGVTLAPRLAEAPPARLLGLSARGGPSWEDALMPHMWRSAGYGVYGARTLGGWLMRTRGIFSSTPESHAATLGERLEAKGLTRQSHPSTFALVERLDRAGDRHVSLAFNHIDVLAEQRPRELERIATRLLRYIGSSPNAEAIEMTRELLQDVAYPSSIGQGNKGTCAATAIQVLFATAQPTRYVDTAIRLIGEQPVALPGGGTLMPRNDWRKDPSDGRNISSRVLQNAFMNHGMLLFSYDSPEDDGASEPGLSSGGAKKVLAGLQPFGAVQVDADFWATKGMLMQSLEDDLARGRAVVVMFPGHAVLALGMSGVGAGRKVLINSDGVQYQVPYDVLKPLLQSIVSVDDAGRDNRKVGGTVHLGDRG